MFKKLGSKLFKKDDAGETVEKDKSGIAAPEDSNEEVFRIIEEEFENIKENRVQIQGSDFDRAFEFIEKHPDDEQTKQLIEEMNETNSYSLKGLSYRSAVNILDKMPDHLGAQSIINGMYSIDKEYIKNLISDVLIFILEVAPDHPHADTLATAITEKNLTNAYNFINRNPSHPQTKFMIRAMFEKDPNIAVLLLQEKMDHPQVASIIQGLYSIDSVAAKKLTPNAIIFILEVAPDHQYTEDLIQRLVVENYIKAYEFMRRYSEYPHLDILKQAIYKRKPDLKGLA